MEQLDFNMPDPLFSRETDPHQKSVAVVYYPLPSENSMCVRGAQAERVLAGSYERDDISRVCSPLQRLLSLLKNIQIKNGINFVNLD